MFREEKLVFRTGKKVVYLVRYLPEELTFYILLHRDRSC